MGAAADELDRERICRRRQRSHVGNHLADGEPPIHVGSEDRRDPVQDSSVENGWRATSGLFRRLQHHDDVSHCRVGGEKAGRSNRPCGVDIVTARMHHPRGGGRKGEPGRFMNGQGIDVTANGNHGRVRSLPADPSPRAGAADTAEVRRELLEFFQQPGGGALFFEGEFRVAVQVLPQGDETPHRRVVERIADQGNVQISRPGHGYHAASTRFADARRRGSGSGSRIPGGRTR